MRIIKLKVLLIQILLLSIASIFITPIKKNADHIVIRKGNQNAPAFPKVLALGDSICEGRNNEYKAFVGDLPYKYDNIGVSGASLSTIRKNIITIPSQLDEYFSLTKDNEDGYPDIIIANGGVNDYWSHAIIGNSPIFAAKTDKETEELDKDTILGGLELLFYKMVKYYPKAHRFFILGHKTTHFVNGKKPVDWTVTKNYAGYTLTELYNEFKNVCKIYGVVCIDIYNKGIINSAFQEYRSKIPYTQDNSVTFTEFVDVDGVHPLAYGYKNGYIPLIKRAIKPYTKKIESVVALAKN